MHYFQNIYDLYAKKKPEVLEIKDFGFLAQKEGFEPSHGFTRLLP